MASNQWVSRVFGDCAELVHDTVQPAEAKSMPYIGLEHIAENKLMLIGCGTSSDVTSMKSRFKKGDILFGKLRPYFRKVISAPFEGVCSTDIWVVRPKANIDRRFLFYWMASQEFVDESMRGSGGTKMPRAQWEFVSRIKRNIPTLIEQEAIGIILGALDEKIELNRRMNETLEAMARAFFKSWFVDFDPVRAKAKGRDTGLPKHIVDLFPDSFVDSELGEIPKGWGVCSLGDILDFAYGKALKAEERHDGTIPVYGSNGQVGWHDERLVTGPGIVVGRKGNPGVVTWAATDFYVIDTAFYVVPKSSAPNMNFLFHALRLHDLASLSADSAVPGLNRNLVYMSKQVLPEQFILKRFGEIARCLVERVHKLEEESRILAALRDTLLPPLLSGDLSISATERIFSV